MTTGLVIMSKRKALGYTQQTLADKLNVSFQAVSKWENGTNYPEIEMRPPVKPLKVLDICCREGKDAVFLPRNGYIVTAFDLSENGIEKGKKLVEKYNTYVDFFKADITDFRATGCYAIIFSSGVFHFIKPEIRKEITANLKEYTNKNGIHAINVFVDKPFLEVPPDKDARRFRWNSGELFMLYHDWKLHNFIIPQFEISLVKDWIIFYMLK